LTVLPTRDVTMVPPSMITSTGAPSCFRRTRATIGRASSRLHELREQRQQVRVARVAHVVRAQRVEDGGDALARAAPHVHGRLTMLGGTTESMVTVRMPSG